MSSGSPFDEFKQYLPRYLSGDEQQSLFRDLSQFPANINDRMYTRSLWDEPYVFQGDGIRDMLVVELPDTSVKPAPCMVISNTCDMSPENRHPTPMRAAYAPIINLSKFEAAIDQTQAVNDYLADVRKQRVSNVFYLPQGGGLEYEGMVMLDRLNNCGLSALNNDSLPERRLFTLSNYGFYVFVFKLSIHFTRIREQVARG